MYGVLFDMPDATSTFSSIGEWSKPIFNEFWPYALVVVGISLGFYVISWIVSHFKQP